MAALCRGKLLLALALHRHRLRIGHLLQLRLERQLTEVGHVGLHVLDKDLVLASVVHLERIEVHDGILAKCLNERLGLLGRGARRGEVAKVDAGRRRLRRRR